MRTQAIRNMAMDKHDEERYKRTEYPKIDPYVSGTDHLDNHDIFGGTQRIRRTLMFK